VKISLDISFPRWYSIGVVAKLCALPGCHTSFIPKREWQICCTKKHNNRLRYLRRKAKLKATVEVEITAPIKVDNPRMSVKIEGIT